MLYFSYQFFFSSFNFKFLRKYSGLLSFHMLYKYNLIAINYLYQNLYQFLFSRSYFLLHFIPVVQVGSILKMKLSFMFIYFISMLQNYNRKYILYAKINSVYNIYFNLIIKYIFILNNYNQCLFNNYFHMKLLNNIQQYKDKFIVWNKGIRILPSVTRIITLLKSPHVHKKARDQYFFSIRKMGFLFKNFLIFYPKFFYLNFLNSLTMQLKRNLHFYN